MVNFPEQMVNSKGQISMPFVGAVQAGGRRSHEGHFSGMPEIRMESGGGRNGGNNNRFGGRGSGGR
jgi:hypothetical protein